MEGFVDETTIEVSSGHGGAGSVSFRREKYVPFGGPDGGDGGRGGDVIFQVKENVKTLAHLRMRRNFHAQNGQPGMGERRFGKDGARAHLIGGVCIGKGPLLLAGPNISIEGLEVSGITVGDGNGACIRLDPGSRDITLKNLYFRSFPSSSLGTRPWKLQLPEKSQAGA